MAAIGEIAAAEDVAASEEADLRAAEAPEAAPQAAAQPVPQAGRTRLPRPFEALEAAAAERLPVSLSTSQLEDILNGLSGKVREGLRAMDEPQLMKLAGELAAKQMWQHEKAIRLSHGDPIDFWERSRAQIATLLREVGSEVTAWAAEEWSGAHRLP